MSPNNTTTPINALETALRKGELPRAALAELREFLAIGGLERNQGMVGVREFVESPHYMNAAGVLYPAVMDALVELNEGDYQEAVLTGGIGVAKSTLALYTQAYQLYLLSTFRNPQAVFNLDPSSEIVFIFQNINRTLAKQVEFDRFRSMILASPYFREHFSPDPRVESELRFPARIMVKPVTGMETAAIGQNVIGGVIDEVNFMAVIDRSRRSADGGRYDQALALYNAIARRRKSRFLRGGRLPGVVCLVSSKRYPGQFTDRKMDEAAEELRRTGRSTIYVYDRTIWEIKPPGTFGNRWFDVFVGDMTRQPRILEPGEVVAEADRHLVRAVPEEFRSEFERDLLNALRDIAGVATRALRPFLGNPEAVAQCFHSAPAILSRGSVDFVESKLTFYPGRFKDPHAPRFLHADLALSGDSAGLVCGFVSGFASVQRGPDVERLPNIEIDFVLEVRPPKNGEIQLFKLRELIYRLREHGLNMRWCSFDGFQSRDSIQVLRQKGFMTGLQSVDRTTTPYEIMKMALYDGRVRIPHHAKLERELLSLEIDERVGRVDHPPNGSKDLADALAGVVYGLTIRREVWALHRIPLVEPPKSLMECIQSARSMEGSPSYAGAD